MGAGVTSVGGVLVPAVKSDAADPSAGSPSPPQSKMEQKSDKDILCPICMEIMKDAFLTACGRSICYMLISSPSIIYLYPNFLLNKGCEASIKDLESLSLFFQRKNSKMEQEEAETNLQILLDFMLCLRKKKLDELNEYIREDINAVEKRRIELYRQRDRYSAKLKMCGDDPSSKSAWPSVTDKHSYATAFTPALAPDQYCLISGDLQNKKADARSSASHLLPRKDSYVRSNSQNLTQSGLVMARKRRVHSQFNDLQDCYLQKRRYWARQVPEQRGPDSHSLNREGYIAGLEDFQSFLSTFPRYSRLRVVAEL